MLSGTPEGFEDSNNIRIQMHRSRRAIFSFREFNRATVKMHLRPGAGILLAEAHPCVNARHKLTQMLRKSLGDDFV